MRNPIMLIDSFGLEIETENIQRGNLPPGLSELWNEVHDASIESDAKAYKIGSSSITLLDPNNVLRSSPRIVIGSEFVSQILDANNSLHWNSVDRLVSWLYSKGEPEESFRSGIHVHVAMAYNLRVLKSLSYLARHLEQVFYYVGGMGYQFRGVLNDFIYCRPLTGVGPTVSSDGDGHVMQCFDINNMIKAEDVDHFWDAYGGINPLSPPDKYYPVRYNWFTLFPLLSKGTVEFRVFNKTLNPLYIRSIVQLCRAFCSFTISTNPDDLQSFPEKSIYSRHSKDSVLDDFNKFADYAGIDATSRHTLNLIIQRTPDIVAEPKLVFSHLNNGRSLRFRYRHMPYLDRDDVCKPNYVDLHVLRGE